MTRIPFLLAAAALGCLPGCHWCGNRVGTGFRFEILKPPVVEQSAPLIVQQSPGCLSTQSLGTVCGPISQPMMVQGACPYPQQAAVPSCPCPYPQSYPCPPSYPPVSYGNGAAVVHDELPHLHEAPPVREAPPSHGPAVREAPRLTLEEWCELMREAARQRGGRAGPHMPLPPGTEPRPKHKK